MSGERQALADTRAFIREWARSIPNSPTAGELDHLANAPAEYVAPLVAALRNPSPAPLAWLPELVSELDAAEADFADEIADKWETDGPIAAMSCEDEGAEYTLPIWKLRALIEASRNPSPAQGEAAIEIAKEALAHIGDPSFMRGEWSGDEMIYHWIGAEDFQVIARKALGRITALAQRATQESENG